MSSASAIIASQIIIDLTEQEAAHSDAYALDCAALRRPEIIAARPPAPSKFTRRQTRTRCEETSQVARSDLSCIQAVRRQICEQIYDSELCPVMGTPEQEDLWASLDTFMQ